MLWGVLFCARFATTEGSSKTIPLLDTYTKVFAVPRSMPISRERLKRLKKPTVLFRSEKTSNPLSKSSLIYSLYVN